MNYFKLYWSNCKSYISDSWSKRIFVCMLCMCFEFLAILILILSFTLFYFSWIVIFVGCVFKKMKIMCDLSFKTK